MSAELKQPNEGMSAAENSKSVLRRHDLVIAVVVWCLALAASIESWRLTFFLDLPGVDPEKAWLVAPGIFPLVLSVGLLCMFSVIIRVSLKEGEFKGHFSSSRALKVITDSENLAQFVQISLLCLFVFVLVGRIHFSIAAGLYLFASMFAARAGKWYVILLISIFFSIAVTFLFGSVMKIPLP